MNVRGFLSINVTVKIIELELINICGKCKSNQNAYSIKMGESCGLVVTNSSGIAEQGEGIFPPNIFEVIESKCAKVSCAPSISSHYCARPISKLLCGPCIKIHDHPCHYW